MLHLLPFMFCQRLFFLGDRYCHHLSEKIGQLGHFLCDRCPQTGFLDAVDIVALDRSLQTVHCRPNR
jgi:hypothetical protein